jgi:hypothetical protein
MVLATKKDGGIRVFVEFTILNQNIIRPKFDTATPFQAMRTILPSINLFTVTDALKVYHQVRPEEESEALTTFSTPFGRYQYRCLSFGIPPAGDDYSRRVSEVFDDIPNCRQIVEDEMVFLQPTRSISSWRPLFSNERPTTTSQSIFTKIVFAQPTARFRGYIVSSQGFKPNSDLTKQIREFPLPKNITDVRAFHGLCKQAGIFSTKVASR